MEGPKKVNNQDEFLNTAKSKKKELTFYLVSGLPIKGRIKSYDSFTILIEKDEKNLLIYKHAISTITE
ncbi:MAG: RNA chaperone Hfq [Spirochaetes bacterium]|nr:RNA chaperone Hfq [Spirochaetota bacterium]